MPTFEFYATADETYFPSGNQYERRDDEIIQGFSYNEDDAGNRRAIILFNSSDIRSKLSGLRITGCYLDVYVRDVVEWQAILLIGTHNHTSLPYTYQSSRVNPRRVSKTVSVGSVSNISLGTIIGTELRDGVSTGLALGPASDSNSRDSDYMVAISRSYDSSWSRRPKLVIVAEPANQAPNSPSLLEPTSGAVVNAANLDTYFRWSHNDPNADPQTAFRFQRRQVTGTSTYGPIQWWNGTAWVTTQTDLATTALNSEGRLVIPAGQFATDQLWEWTVATRDSSNLWGGYAAWRRLYSSTPPTATITEPAVNYVPSPRPTIRWAFSDIDGEAQHAWSAQIVEPSVYNVEGYNPDNYLGQVWSASGEGTTSAAQPNVDLRNHRTYRAYVKVGSSPNPSGGIQYSLPWAFKQFEIVVPPSPPTILFPSNGSVADLEAGFTLEWRNQYYSNIGSQTAFRIRRRNNSVTNSPYEVWNGTAWVAEDAFTDYLPGATTAYTFRPSEVLNGFQYVFSVRVVDDYGQTSTWSSGAQVLASSAAQVTVLAPQTSTNVTNPTVTWTMFDKENDPQQSWRVKIIHSSVFPATGDIV